MPPGARRSLLAPEIRAFGPGTAQAPPDRPLPRTAGRIQGSALWLAEAHRERLRAWAPGSAWFDPAFDQLLDTFLEGGDGVLRIRLDEPGRQLWAHWEPLPETPQPYHLVIRAHPLTQALAPRIKGMDGAWSAPVLEDARRSGAADALLVWPDGSVAETAIAAVALQVGNELWCPPPAGRVASLAEQHLLPRWADARDLRLGLKPIPLERLGTAPLWCFNAVRGVWPAEVIGSTLPGRA